LLTFVFGFVTSTQYTSMNTLADADVSADEASSASTIASTVQPPSRGDVFAVAPVSA
jgi:hypothetical protein